MFLYCFRPPKTPALPAWVPSNDIHSTVCLHPEVPTPDPRNPASNVTLSPQQKEELARIRKKQLANAVHYIWETGEDKYMLRYFHTGFWLSCEKHNEGWWVEQTLIRDRITGELCAWITSIKNSPCNIQLLSFIISRWHSHVKGSM